MNVQLGFDLSQLENWGTNIASIVSQDVTGVPPVIPGQQQPTPQWVWVALIGGAILLAVGRPGK